MGDDKNQVQNEFRGNQFRVGDLALLLDRKNRKYLVTLGDNQVFHSHLGRLSHDQVIDHSVGGWYHTDRGHTLLAVRPTLADFVLEMPRGPQIIYPKDLGLIVSLGDIFPGATVVEGGLGSGSLTAALLRAVGSTGQVITYEIDEKVVPKAQRNIQQILPDTSNLSGKDRRHLPGDGRAECRPGGVGRAGTLAGGARNRRCPGHGRHLVKLSAHYTAGAPTGYGIAGRHTLPAIGNHRDPFETLACCRAQRSSRPPHGSPQRFSHHGGSVPASENWDRG